MIYAAQIIAAILVAFFAPFLVGYPVFRHEHGDRVRDWDLGDWIAIWFLGMFPLLWLSVVMWGFLHAIPR